MTLRRFLCWLIGHRWPRVDLNTRNPRCLRCGKSMTYRDVIDS